MSVVWKYPLPAEANPVVRLPDGATILHGDVQQHSVMIWALVDPDARPRPRMLHLVATGDGPPHDSDEYLNTLFAGSFVFHLFEHDMEVLP